MERLWEPIQTLNTDCAFLSVFGYSVDGELPELKEQYKDEEEGSHNGFDPLFFENSRIVDIFQKEVESPDEALLGSPAFDERHEIFLKEIREEEDEGENWDSLGRSYVWDRHFSEEIFQQKLERMRHNRSRFKKSEPKKDHTPQKLIFKYEILTNTRRHILRPKGTWAKPEEPTTVETKPEPIPDPIQDDNVIAKWQEAMLNFNIAGPNGQTINITPRINGVVLVHEPEEEFWMFAKWHDLCRSMRN